MQKTTFGKYFLWGKNTFFRAKNFNVSTKTLWSVLCWLLLCTKVCCLKSNVCIVRYVHSLRVVYTMTKYNYQKNWWNILWKCKCFRTRMLIQKLFEPIVFCYRPPTCPWSLQKRRVDTSKWTICWLRVKKQTFWGTYSCQFS